MESYACPATAREIANDVGVSSPKAEVLLMHLCKENKVKKIMIDGENDKPLYVISESNKENGQSEYATNKNSDEEYNVFESHYSRNYMKGSEKMIVYGVGRDGGYITVNNDIIVRIEYGNYYYAENTDKFRFIYIRPEKRPFEYKEGPFEIEDISADGKLKLTFVGPLKSYAEVDIETALKDSVRKIGGVDKGTNYKIVKNDSQAKMGYYYKTINFMGMEVRSYNILVFTKYNNLYTVEASFATPNHLENERYIENFLKSLNIIDESVRKSNELKRV